MIQWLRQKLFRLVLWGSNKFSSRPKKDKVFEGLSKIMAGIKDGKESKGVVIPFDAATGRIIIFSDQHKGAKNGADDFMLCEPAYLAALEHYYKAGFHFIALGDCEELWENTLTNVVKHQQPSIDSYKQFIAENRFYKVIGNHDLDWKNDLITIALIKSIFGTDIPIYDGVLLQTTIGTQPLQILCTHGHQGDAASDGAWFSKFFISKIWAPLQIWLKINPNTPAYDAQLKSLHNRLMYQWSSQQNGLLLVTGHTHQPVFSSLTHIERLYRQLLSAQAQKNTSAIKAIETEIQKRKFEYTVVSPDYLTMKPTYFNSGCCCNNDGDINGIEIEGGCIRLIKWSTKKGGALREVMEEETLKTLSPGPLSPGGGT